VELVLGGGGVKGYGHVGFLKYIEEKKIPVSRITGISIGSAVAAFYANGFGPEQLTDILFTEFGRFGAATPERSAKIRQLMRGGIDLEQLFTDVVRRYGLRPQPNLRILTYNLLQRKTVVFEGTDYDLGKVIAASCAVPGMMRPVWYGQKGVLTTLFEVITGKRSDEGIFIDAGVRHPSPGEFSPGPAIISKLGLAQKLPSMRLPLADFLLHVGEFLASRPLHWYWADSKNPRHIVVSTGKPEIASLSFALPRDICLQMVEAGYRATKRMLDPEIANGRIPAKV
jgi:hypothetical protein